MLKLSHFKLDPLLALNPFLVPGEAWKASRSQLAPIFVAGRIRTAIPYVNNVAKTLMEYIESGPESATMEFDVKDVSEVFITILTFNHLIFPLLVGC